LFIAGCTKSNNIEERIRDKIKDCDNNNCIIEITKLTDFHWDKMYVFNEPESPDVIDQAIGINYPYYEEFSHSIIFLNKRKIVHYENNESDIETATDGSIMFDYPDTLRYKVYIPAEVKFRFKVITFSKGAYYKLYQ
jgi:hypothetical protein